MKNYFVILTFLIGCVSLIYSQEKPFSDEQIKDLNENIKQDEYKNQFQVLAYRYGWDAKTKSGLVVLVYKEYGQTKNNVKKNLNWSEFKSLLFLLENNEEVILNLKSRNVYSKYKRPGEL